MYTRPHGYWFIRRIARRFLENDFGLMWDYDKYFEEAIAVLRKLRETAKLFPATPWKRWAVEKMGEVRLICCPNCGGEFTWEGHFYAPQCPGCNRCLTERQGTTP
jgi:hypothetical protein